MAIHQPVRTGFIGPIRSWPVSSGGGGGVAGTTVDELFPIDDGGHDGDYNGGFDDSGDEIDIGHDGGNSKKGWFYFDATGIPQGATILHSWMVFYASADSADLTVRVIIRGADEDNPAVPAGVADADGRPRTTAEVAWEVEPWLSGNLYNSPSITAVIQELVDRPTFAEDAVLIFIEDNGSTVGAGRRIRSYNGVASNAAQLYVQWVTAAPCTAPAAPTNLTATYNGVAGMNLAWTDNSANEDGFRIERGTDGIVFAQIASVAADTVAYLDDGLAGGTYHYRVRAYNGCGNSAYSNIDSDAFTFFLLKEDGDALLLETGDKILTEDAI
jgi:hypothetical protein